MQRSRGWAVLAACFLSLGLAGCGGENLFTGVGTGDPEPTGSIQGVVTADGEPRAGVWLVLSQRNDSTQTNAQGQYSFPDLPRATYDLSLRVPLGYILTVPEASPQRVTVGPGAVTVNWQLQRQIVP